MKYEKFCDIIDNIKDIDEGVSTLIWKNLC